jgi:ABC-2 type transport system ATP-binding protein
VLEVRGLQRSFGSRQVLRGVSFDARDGEVLALLGANGAGKTTTLRCVAGLLIPDGGEVLLVDEADRGERRPARGAVAFVPDEPDLYPGLTVAEHVRFIALAYRVPRWQPRAAELLSRFSLAEHAELLPIELSHGMRRKVGIVMGLLHGARAVILDEPFNGLDPPAIHELRQVIADLATGGVAVLLSTHLLTEAERIAKRIAVLHAGRILAEGTLAQLRTTAGLAAGADLESVYLRLTRSQP